MYFDEQDRDSDYEAETNTLVKKTSKIDFYIAEKSLNSVSIDLTKENIITTTTKIEKYLSSAFDDVFKIIKENDSKLFITEEKSGSICSDASAQTKSISNIFSESKSQIMENIVVFLDAHLISDRYSLVDKRKKLTEKLFIARDSNEEFRRSYDIAARDRETTTIRSMCNILEEKHDAEITALKLQVRQLNMQIQIYIQQVEVLKKENSDFRDDCKKKDEHLKLLNKLALVQGQSPLVASKSTKQGKSSKAVDPAAAAAMREAMALRDAMSRVMEERSVCNLCAQKDQRLCEETQALAEALRKGVQAQEQMEKEQKTRRVAEEEKRRMEMVSELLNKDLQKKVAEHKESEKRISELTSLLEKETADLKELTQSNEQISERLRTSEEELTAAQEQVVLYKESLAAMEHLVDTRTHLLQLEHPSDGDPSYSFLAHTSTSERSTHSHHSHGHPHAHHAHDHKGHSTKSRPGTRESAEASNSHHAAHHTAAHSEHKHKNRSSKSPLRRDNLVDAATDTDQDMNTFSPGEAQNILLVHPPAEADTNNTNNNNGDTNPLLPPSDIPRPDSQPSSAKTSKPKYISLLAINSNSGILNNARMHQSRNTHSAKNTSNNTTDKAAANNTSNATNPSVSTPSKGILKNTSFSTDPPTNGSSTPHGTSFKAPTRSNARRSFNDESESPSQSRHDPAVSAATATIRQLHLQQLPLSEGEAARRPHTTGQLGEGDIDMGSSRDRDTWQLPISPQVKISRRNPPPQDSHSMLTSQQQQQHQQQQQQEQQQMNGINGISHLIQLTAALEDQLGRTQQDKDRAVRHIRLCERRREKTELLCQLKLQESALLLQELSEQLLAAKQESAELQKHLQQQQQQQNKGVVSGGGGGGRTATQLRLGLGSPEKTKLVEAETLLPKIDHSGQVQGKDDFSAGKVMKSKSLLLSTLSTSKSDTRLPSRISSRRDPLLAPEAFPSRSLTPSAIQSIVVSSSVKQTDGKMEELRNLRSQISLLSRELLQLQRTSSPENINVATPHPSSEKQRFAYPPTSVT